MESISAQIERLLNQQASESGGLIDNYRVGLSLANDQDRSSIDKFREIYSDSSKFEKPLLGALGAGLMKGGNGNFQDSIASGLGAAIDAQDENRKANLSREEKLAKLDALQATLTRQQAGDSLDAYTKRGELATSLGGTQKSLADIGLEDQIIAEDLDTTVPQHVRIWNEYTKNPRKFSGPEGQLLVTRAAAMIKQDMIEKGKMAKANRPPQLTNVDKKAVLEAKTSNANLNNNLNNLKRALDLGPKSWGGPGASLRARMSTWIGAEPGSAGDALLEYGGLDDQASANAQVEYSQIMQGEAIKQMAETLKGATTDREMLKFIEIAADDSVPWGPAKKAAIERVISFAELMKQNNDDTIKGIAEGTYYSGDGQPPDRVDDLEPPSVDLDVENLPDDIKAWAVEQLDGGADEATVLQYLQENYGGQ